MTMKKMLQLPMIFVLIISLFVVSIPGYTIQKDGHDKSVVSAPTNLKNSATNITTDNNTTNVASTVHVPENNTENSNNTKVPEPPKNVAKGNETEPRHIEKGNEDNKHKYNSLKEQDDMRCSHVSPHDSGEETDDNSSESTSGPKETERDNTTKASTDVEVNPLNSTKTTPVTKEVTKKTEVDKTSTSSTVVVDIYELSSTKTTQSVTYDVVSTEATTHVVNTSSTEEVSKSTVKPVIANDTVTANYTVAPLVEDKVPNAELNGVVREVKSADRNKSMSSGVIALIIAISFGVAIAIVYIGMIVWRRYIEYRYGHRELLVNELEFDTNDLRHFEL